MIQNAAMHTNEFPFLDAAALRAFELLEIPIHIYSFETQSLAWANGEAIRLWNASSLAELQQRVLTPFSSSTSRRLKSYLEGFRRGETFQESWTVYPKGMPVPALVRVSGVSLHGHREAMLCENRLLGPLDLPGDELRAIEALRHTPALISMIADDGQVLLQNPAAKEFFAARADAAAELGAEFSSVFADPSDYQWLLKQLQDAGHAERTVAITGSKSCMHTIQATRIVDPLSGAPFTLWVQQDVSELWDTTQRLAESEAALDVMLGLNASPALVLDAADGSLLKANFSGQSLFRLRGEKAKVDHSVFAEKKVERDFVDRVLAEGSYSKVALLATDTGRTFWAMISGTRLPFGNSGSLLMIINDIDDLQKAAEELETALTFERQISKMQRSVLQIASHEFRTPLSVIDGAAQRISRRAHEITPEQLVELASRIRNFVSQLISLLDQTIERAKLNEVGVKSSPVPSRLHHLMHDLARSFSDIVDISVHSSVEDLPDLLFDKSLVSQAFVNLIENAIKYSKSRANIKIWAEIEDGSAAIYVRDRGIGIPAEQREAVFSDGVRGTNVGERPGSGLGLSIVRKIFVAQGGGIVVWDSSDKGTTMKIALPVACASPEVRST